MKEMFKINSDSPLLFICVSLVLFTVLAMLPSGAPIAGLETVASLSDANRMLCEREVAMVGVLDEFEEQNQRLSIALFDALDKLQVQEVKINDLIDENTRYRIRIRVLTEALRDAQAKLNDPEKEENHELE